ncbi:dihydrolipoamide acetyltransferase family protein [Metabacillus rhizolycopersici]|uniref:Dihydrolipoamide acetyltransferase component of pyruvate dehydrogenase complex n=1 Tax=Metabacillus rhizolycopersici TaxID=2875709 RepID=A0ABS7UQ27_9BACI|nr:dihydrolipoamide acetyltransferase family protein [Metabacillus rhizolycopersici]MBZ5750334.1 2-oxo acid dehydrogenase subunit E2 [Metabacillus rhizolycopersici]
MSGTIVMPKLGMTMTEGKIVEWYKEVGDPVNQGEAILMISSEKLNQEIEAPIAGVLLNKNGEVEDELKVGATIAVIGEEGKTVLTNDNEAVQPTTAIEKPDNSDYTDVLVNKEEKTMKGDRLFITPLAKKMAKDNNFDMNLIKGTGGNGRITKQDIQRVLANGLDYKSDLPTQPASVDVEVVGEGLPPMRKAIARNMRRSLGQTAQLTLHRKANADNLIDFQKVLRKEIESTELDVKLTLTVLIARATVLALQDLKKMNSLYQDGQLTEFDEVHLGIATSLEDGLVVPVIKDAHQKTIGNLAREIKELTGKARNGEASGDLLSGSTFTITNLGASGIEYFTPILNTPETGILGVGAFQDELILTEKGKVKSVKKIPFSVTFDHQIVDGATAADFLTILTKYIESPYLLVL